MLRSALWVPFLLAACSSSSDSSAGAGDGGSGGGGGANATVKTSCVAIINQYRATLSLPAYAEWTDEETCADGEAQSDSQTGKAHGAFGSCKEMAQDECPSYPSGDLEGSLKQCLQLMWNEGPGTDFSTHGHYINMSNASYTEAACGIYVTPDGKMWSVQNFK